jgi:HIRAN domain
MVTLKIAGTKFYTTATPEKGSKLTLRSNPDNRYDSNAIEILDKDGNQLGHVPAAAAAVMTLYAQKVGYPVGKLFEAVMDYEENFTLDMVEEL